ncbi:MAG: N-acetyltransferase [Actinobacteria bacterium]|nr:N-acetyltransferase [Actinomycetota bacterium]
MTDDNLTFFHDAPHDRFVLADAEGPLGTISYTYSDGVYDLQHTVVEPSANGRGLGTRLATATFQWIRDHHSRFIPTCSFLPVVLEKYPEYNDLAVVEEGADEPHRQPN